MIQYIGIGILGFAGVTIAWVYTTYNNVINAREDIKNLWSTVKAEYQRRYDLIGTLVDSVKGQVKFEKETMIGVAKARAGALNDKTVAKEMNNIRNSERNFAKIMLQMERYPQLKANQGFLKLNDEIGETEDRINAARTDFNNTVRDYNVYIKSFPNNMLSSKFGWKAWNLFELVNEEADKRVSFTI